MALEGALYYSNDIVGANTKGGRDGSSAVIEFDHQVYSPTDTQRGIVSGARVHGNVELIKEIDTASANLYKACCNGETLDELKVEWYRISPTGQEEVYFTQGRIIVRGKLVTRGKAKKADFVIYYKRP